MVYYGNHKGECVALPPTDRKRILHYMQRGYRLITRARYNEVMSGNTNKAEIAPEIVPDEVVPVLEQENEVTDVLERFYENAEGLSTDELSGLIGILTKPELVKLAIYHGVDTHGRKHEITNRIVEKLTDVSDNETE